MFSNDGSLSLTAILGPILGRILQNGTSANDLIYVIKQVEQKPLSNAGILAENWSSEWEKMATKYLALGNDAESRGHTLTAESMYFLAAMCFRSGSLINSGTIESKIEAHVNCTKWYRRYVDVRDKKIVPVTVPYKDKGLPAYLHLPSGSGPFPCAVMFGGVGGCKEEVHALGRAFAKRGLAVLTVDLPGLGESLLVNRYHWRLSTVVDGITRSIAALRGREEIQSDRIGVYGLCLGGGMAYKYAATHPDDVAFAASMFPMLLNREAIENTPVWIKSSTWFSFFSGNAKNLEFEKEMRITDDLAVQCPYLLIHGRDDNWTPLERAMKLYEQATSTKDKLIVEERAVHESGHQTTHTMPVVDQFHWTVPLTGDKLMALIKSIDA